MKNDNTMPSGKMRTQIAQRIKNGNTRRIMLYMTLIGFVILFVSPLVVAIVTSFKTRTAVIQTLPYLPPGMQGFTLENWTHAFAILRSGLVNSLILVVPVAIISAILGSLTAYGLTQTDWRGQTGIMAFLIAAIFLPPQAAIVPLSRLWAIYFPLDKLLMPIWELPLLKPYHGDLLETIITLTAFGLPICTVLFRSYYKGISDEMIESARVDGASLFSTYRRIVLPLSGPMFAVTIVYQFTQSWNAFLLPLVIMGSSNHPAAPVTLSLVGLGRSLTGTDFGLRMAGALLTALPTLVVFLLFGEEFAKGITGQT